MNELFGSSDSDEDDGGGERAEEREEGEPRAQPTEGDDERMLKSSSPPPALPPPMRIPTSLHDALPPSRNRLAKLPASVRIVQEAFREEGFEGDDREGVDVRWRYGLDERGGTALVRESNARVVTWSDGSQTLHVGGNAAVYNVKAIDIDKDETFLYANVQRLIQVRFLFCVGGVSRCLEVSRGVWRCLESGGRREGCRVGGVNVWGERTAQWGERGELTGVDPSGEPAPHPFAPRITTTR
jgi:hypothetical protein